MAKVIIDKRKNFTTISNTIFKDTKLSFKAKGLLVSMWSCPPTWNFTIEGLSKLSTDGKASVRAAVKELEDSGYLVRQKVKNEKGQYCDWEYTLHEEPVPEEERSKNGCRKDKVSENPTSGKPTFRKSDVGKTDSGKSNTIKHYNKLNTDNNIYSNNNIDTDNNVDIYNKINNNKKDNVLHLKDMQQNNVSFSRKREDENQYEENIEEQNKDIENDMKTREEIERQIYLEKEYADKVYARDVNEINKKAMPTINAFFESRFPDRDYSWELQMILLEFHRQYYLTYGTAYKMHKEFKYEQLASHYMKPPKCMEDDGVYDSNIYADLIDLYFKTEYNKQGKYAGKIEKTLFHFFNSTILKNLYQRVRDKY